MMISRLLHQSKTMDTSLYCQISFYENIKAQIDKVQLNVKNSSSSCLLRNWTRRDFASTHSTLAVTQDFASTHSTLAVTQINLARAEVKFLDYKVEIDNSAVELHENKDKLGSWWDQLHTGVHKVSKEYI